MRFVSMLFVASFVLPACGGSSSDAEPYDTLQACFDDHTMVENLPTKEAVVVCCIDHPIAGQKKSCGTDQASCVSHLMTNLTGVTMTDITASCMDYVTQLAM